MNPSIAMEASFSHLQEWRKARSVDKGRCLGARESVVYRWLSPDEGYIKLNANTSFYTGADSFNIGMVIRDLLELFWKVKLCHCHAHQQC